MSHHFVTPDNTITPIFQANGQTLWQTGRVVASDLEQLRREVPRCGLVVVCADYHPSWSRRVQTPTVAVVPLRDSLAGLGREHVALLDHAWRMVDRGWQAGRDVVVACEAGVQRSAGVVLCWLTRARGLGYDEALALLQSTRGNVTGYDYLKLFLPGRQPADGLFGHVFEVANAESFSPSGDEDSRLGVVGELCPFSNLPRR